MIDDQHQSPNLKRISFKRNVVFSVISWFLPLVFGFVATPLILHQIGVRNYGLFSLILGFISYSFAFNVGRAVTRYTAEFRGNGEFAKIDSVISSALFINLILGFAGLVSISLLANWLIVDVFRVSEDLREAAKIGFYIAGFTIFLTMISQIFIAVLQGIHRFDLYSSVVTVSSLLLVIGNLVLVYLGFEVQGLLVWNLITITLSTIAYFAYSQNLQKIQKFSFDSEIMKIIALYGSSVTVYQVCGSLILLVERTIITRMFGEENLTFYVIPMAIGMYMHSMISSLTVAIFPITSETNSDENRERLLSIYMKSTKFVCALVACVSVVLIAANTVVLRLWIGGTLGEQFAEKSSDVFVIQIITFGLLAIVIISWILVEGVKNASYNALQAFLWLVIGTSAMIWLAPIYSSYGVAVGRLMGVSIIPITILIAEKWIFSKVLWRFWAKNLIILAFASAGSFFLERFLLDAILQSRVVFAVEAAFVSSIFFLLIYLFGFFDYEEKVWLRNFLKF